VKSSSSVSVYAFELLREGLNCVLLVSFDCFICIADYDELIIVSDAVK